MKLRRKVLSWTELLYWIVTILLGALLVAAVLLRWGVPAIAWLGFFFMVSTLCLIVVIEQPRPKRPLPGHSYDYETGLIICRDPSCPGHPRNVKQVSDADRS